MKDAKLLLTTLRKKGLTLSVAESLTGGLLADALVSVPGASQTFSGGIVCYKSEAKSAVLGVNPSLIEEHSVVSVEVAKEMAEKCAALFQTDCAIATTGLAGPRGENDPAPVGTVYIGLKLPNITLGKLVRLKGNRSRIRKKAVREAIKALLQQSNI